MPSRLGSRSALLVTGHAQAETTETALDWYRTILDSVGDGVFTVDRDFRVTSFNRAAERITGHSRKEAIGRPCHEVFRASICDGSCALRETTSTGRRVVDARIEVLTKSGKRLPISISTAILRSADGQPVGGVETFRDLSTVEELRKQLSGHPAIEEIVGRHPRLERILEMLPAVAHSDATVLLEGPSGSGKGLLASAIHGVSPRSAKPFVKVSCAALPETLLESELFGYKRGAFTDAKHDKVGRIALAEGGTLFLDEIGDVAPAIQVKLLRVLQEREYEPLGATRTSKANVRVIAASNRQLGELIRAGKFREDLDYRLAVVRIELPSLVERREDIPHLVERFVARFNARTGRTIRGVSPTAMSALQSHHYPGNIRELENAIEHAFVLCGGGMIELGHLPDSIRLASAARPALGPALGSPLQIAEAEVIRQAIERAGGNLTRAAKQLGMHRTTLWRKLRAASSP